jgi:hypothetical protein
MKDNRYVLIMFLIIIMLVGYNIVNYKSSSEKQYTNRNMKGMSLKEGIIIKGSRK